MQAGTAAAGSRAHRKLLSPHARPESWHRTVPGRRAQGGLRILVFGKSPPERTPTFPRGVLGKDAVGAPGVLSQCWPRHGHTEAPLLGTGHHSRQGAPSHPLPLFSSTPSFILFYLNNPRGATAPLPAPPAPRSPGLSTKSCPTWGWGQGQGQHRGGGAGEVSGICQLSPPPHVPVVACRSVPTAGGSCSLCVPSSVIINE